MKAGGFSAMEISLHNKK